MGGGEGEGGESERGAQTCTCGLQEPQADPGLTWGGVRLGRGEVYAGLDLRWDYCTGQDFNYYNENALVFDETISI